MAEIGTRLLDWSRRLHGGAHAGEGDPPETPPDSAWGAEIDLAPDRRLWRALEAGGPASDQAILGIPGLRLRGDGHLLERTATDAVEVWVDRELAAMHAIHKASRRLRRADWGTRLRSAVEWHLEHTGTENATHRPWAIHLFLLHGSPDAEFFASGQLHAVAVEHGDSEPDPCTAWILQDAARELRLAAGTSGGSLP